MWTPVLPTGREEALIETFPAFMREPLYGEILRAWPRDISSYTSAYETKRLVIFQAAMRTDLGYAEGHLGEGSLKKVMAHMTDEVFTNFLDFLLYGDSRWLDAQKVEGTLMLSGSAWTVLYLEDKRRLGRRVPEPVRDAAVSVLGSKSVAANHLNAAWIAAYGVSPNPSSAFASAVKAAEAAALSVIPVNMPEPTLANVFSLLESDNPQWRLIFRDSQKAQGAHVLAGMLRTLWRGHRDRHATSDRLEQVTQAEAEAAVLLAVTLVGWFESGVVTGV